MLKELLCSVWPGLAAGPAEMSNVLVILGASGTLKTCGIPARGVEVPRAASWVLEVESLPCTERCHQAAVFCKRNWINHPSIPGGSLLPSEGWLSGLLFPAMASLAQLQLFSLPSLPPLPGMACQGRLA